MNIYIYGQLDLGLFVKLSLLSIDFPNKCTSTQILNKLESH